MTKDEAYEWCRLAWRSETPLTDMAGKYIPAMSLALAAERAARRAPSRPTLSLRRRVDNAVRARRRILSETVWRQDIAAHLKQQEALWENEPRGG